MQYRRDKKGNELSVLGYGCMRFTKNGSSVDLDKAEKEVMAAKQVLITLTLPMSMQAMRQQSERS